MLRGTNSLMGTLKMYLLGLKKQPIIFSTSLINMISMISHINKYKTGGKYDKTII